MAATNSTTKKRTTKKRALGSGSYKLTDKDFQALFIKGATSDGIVVNESTALELPAILASIRCRSETIGMLPCITYRRLKQGGKERATDHPNYKLLHDEPNNYMPACLFYESGQGLVDTWGNSFNEIEFSRMNKVLGIHPLNPSQVEVGWGSYYNRKGTEIVEGLTYKVTNPDKSTTVLPAWKILHIPGICWDGRRGYSPIQLEASAISSGLYAQKYTSDFYANSAVPSGILNTPFDLDDPEAVKNLRDSWEGMAKGRKTSVLAAGVTWQAVGLPNDVSQLLQQKQFTVQEIARMYRLPASRIGDRTSQVYSNMETENTMFWLDSLLPWLNRWQQEINRKLFAEEPDYFCEFLVDALMRADSAARANYYSVAIDKKWMLRNEVRERENMNAIEGLDDDLEPEPVQTQQLPNQDQTQDQTKGQDQASDERASDERAMEAFSLVALEALRRMGTKEKNARERRGFDAAAFYRDHADSLYSALQPAIVGFALTLSKEDADTDTFLQTTCQEFCAQRLLGKDYDVEQLAEKIIRKAYDSFKGEK